MKIEPRILRGNMSNFVIYAKITKKYNVGATPTVDNLSGRYVIIILIGFPLFKKNI